MNIPVITFYQRNDNVQGAIYPKANTVSQLINPGVETSNLHDKTFVAPKSQKILFIAESTDKTFGGLTLREFAELFMKHIPSDILSHLYLLGPDIGCDTGHQRAFAQQLATYLDKKGYLNICVHAIQQSDLENPLSLEVITYPAVYEYDVEAGFIHVNLAGVPAATAVHPIAFLDREENCFFPREAFEARQRRIELDLNFRKELVAKALLTLQARLNHLIKEHKTEEARLLEKLIHDVQTLQYPDFELLKKMAKKAAANYAQGFLAWSIHSKESSGTYQTLHKLEQGIILDPRVVIERTSSFAQQEKLYPSLSLTEPQRRSIQRDEPEPESPSAILSPSLAPLQQPLLAPDKAPTSANLFLQTTVEIEHLRDTLQREIAQLSESCLRFFHSFEITTKTRKLCALESLLKTEDNTSRAEKAAEFLHNSRVMRSMKTDRTKKLLEQLCADALPAPAPKVLTH